MTNLSDLMQSDVGDVFLVTTEHAESVSYTPADSTAQTINAIVIREQGLNGNQDEDGYLFQKMVTLYINDDDISTISKGDTATIDSETYKVQNFVDDGFGMIKVELELQEFYTKEINSRKSRR